MVFNLNYSSCFKYISSYLIKSIHRKEMSYDITQNSQL